MIVKVSEVGEKTAEIRVYSGDDFDGKHYVDDGEGDEIALVIDEGDGFLGSTSLCSTEARAVAHALLVAADSADEARPAQPARFRGTGK